MYLCKPPQSSHFQSRLASFVKTLVQLVKRKLLSS